MKKLLSIILILFFVLLAGELFTIPKHIARQENKMNVWYVNHFFNLYHTEYRSPMNDTTIVQIQDKNHVNNSYIVHVSDGNTVTLLQSRQVFESAEVGDTVTLIKTYEPVSKNKYRLRYTMLK